MSKRLPIIAIGLIVLFLFITPFAIGMINASALEQRVAEIDENMPFNIELEDFERGWFSSNGRLVLSIGPEFLAQYPELANEPIVTSMIASQTLPFNIEIGHGPILLSNGLSVGTASVTARLSPDTQLSLLAEQFLGMPYVFELRGRAGIGAFNYEGEIPPGEIAMDGNTFSMSGVEFSGKTSKDLQDFEAELASLELQTPFSSAIVEAIRISSHATIRSPESMPLSDSEISVQRVTVSNPLLGGTPMFDINDVSMASDVTEAEESGFLDSSMVIRIGNLIAQGIEINSAALGFRVDHISSEAADQFMAVSREMQTETDPEAVVEKLTSLVDPLFAGGPVVAIEPFQLGMREGNIDGHLRLAVEPGALNMTMMQDPLGAMAALGAFTGELELTATKSLVHMLAAMYMAQEVTGMLGPDGEPISPQDAQMMAQTQVIQVIGMLSAQNLIVDDGDNYTTLIELANGTPTANGQPLPMMGF